MVVSEFVAGVDNGGGEMLFGLQNSFREQCRLLFSHALPRVLMKSGGKISEIVEISTLCFAGFPSRFDESFGNY